METSGTSSTVTILLIRHTLLQQCLLFSLIASLSTSVHPLTFFIACLLLKIDSGLAVMRCTLGFYSSSVSETPPQLVRGQQRPMLTHKLFLIFIWTFFYFLHIFTHRINRHTVFKNSRCSLSCVIC